MMRDIIIKPALNGFVVRVGCQRLVFKDLLSMLTQIEQYYKDPVPVETHIREHSLHSKQFGFVDQDKGCTAGGYAVAAPAYVEPDED